MTLEEELAAQREQAARRRGAGEQRTREQAVEDIRRSGLPEKATGVGDTIPPIALPDPSGRVVDVDALLARGPVVISFYRGGWCPYCNLELRALQAQLSTITELGGSLIAISPELPDNSLTTQERNALMFPVLSDQGNHVARTFGIVHQIAPSVVALQRGNGVDVAGVNGEQAAEVPVPATYVVDTRHEVRFAVVDPDYTHRADPDEVVAVVRAVAAAPGADGEPAGS